MPNTRSRGAPLVPYDPELRKTICKMVNAQKLEAQRQGFGLEAETIARGIQPNVANNQPREVDENIAVNGIIPPHRQPIDPRGKAQYPAHMMGVAGDDANQHLMNSVAICKLQKIPGISQTMMRLRMFPLSLTREATNWLNEMSIESIRTWTALKEAFLERFFPESKELQMKDKISAHKQLPGEAIHDTWWRFSQKLKKFPNRVSRGSFMRKPFSERMQLMDEVSKNNRAWYTRDAELGDLGCTFELSAEQRKREEERDQDMAHMRTQKDLLMNHIISMSEKVNVVTQLNRFEDQDVDLDEEANYLGNQRGFQDYISGNQGYNSGNVGRTYSREGQYDRPANTEHGTNKTKMGIEMIELVSMCPR
ncbi:hypothetical protein KY285_000678 [Solanum tuberosum]|nr:hypothetical protein KY285_000678 [Solanum tuberosum]